MVVCAAPQEESQLLSDNSKINVSFLCDNICLNVPQPWSTVVLSTCLAISQGEMWHIYDGGMCTGQRWQSSRPSFQLCQSVPRSIGAEVFSSFADRRLHRRVPAELRWAGHPPRGLLPAGGRVRMRSADSSLFCRLTSRPPVWNYRLVCHTCLWRERMCSAQVKLSFMQLYLQNASACFSSLWKKKKKQGGNISCITTHNEWHTFTLRWTALF